MSASYSTSATTSGARPRWFDVGALNLGDDIQLGDLLGRGAQTEVYRLRRGGQEFALKIMRTEQDPDDSALLAFCREAALLARLAHPGVPRVFDVGAANEHPYILMEYIEGDPLADRLANGPLAPDELIAMAIDVTSALGAAHRHGLVHRDIKPANIILSNNRARVIDFGLAATGGRDTATETVVGTFDYSAPEQTGMIARPVTPRADLYALGVVMFQCATGVLPYQSSDVATLLNLHATAPVPDPRRLNPQLDERVATVIVGLLAKEPDDRIANARELYDALIAIRGGAPDHGYGPADPAPRLIGRDTERERLRTRWQQAASGTAGVALLRGPAGVGKGSLARDLAGIVQAGGNLVMTGSCDTDTGVPLAPLREAVDAYLRTIIELPTQERAEAIQRIREAAGLGLALLRPLSPLIDVLLNPPELDADERHDQFAGAVAGLLAGLARQHEGLLLIIENAQWLDTTSKSVLRQIADDDSAPMLVLATASDDAAAAIALGETVGPRLDLEITVGNLADEQSAALITNYLGGTAIEPDVLTELVTRGQGNPYTILEYLHGLVEAGALRPAWGSWQLDAQRLQGLNLPTDVYELVAGRIAGLGPHTAQVLTTAAVLSSTFDLELMAELTDGSAVNAVLEAVDAGVLREHHDNFAFVHDRIRDALLAPLTPEDRQRLHQRIAATLDQRAATSPHDVYAIAHHYTQGDMDLAPVRVVATCVAAGQLALAEHAPETAVGFLAVAIDRASTHGMPVDSRLRQSLAQAYLAVGASEPAEEQLNLALAEETDSLRRAALRLPLAQVARTRWELNAALTHIQEGLRELGRALPENPLVLGLRLPLWLLRWLVNGMRKPSRRPWQGEQAERKHLEAQLYQAGAAIAGMSVPSPQLAAYVLRPAGWAHRLGMCSDYVLAHAATATFSTVLRLRGRRERIFRRCDRAAADIGDPKLASFVSWLGGYARLMDNTWDLDQMVKVAETNKRWLEVDFHSNTLLAKARELLATGYATEALEWQARGRARLSTETADTFGGFALVEAAARSLLGLPATMPPSRDGISRQGTDTGYWLQYLPTAVAVAVEQDELGEPFETATTAARGLKLQTVAAAGDTRLIFVYEALGRLARARIPKSQDQRPLIASASEAVRRLDKVARDPLMRAYSAAANASLQQIIGAPERALSILAEAEARLVTLDAPLPRFEMARVRARALTDLGHHAHATHHVDVAMLLASRHGWARRARAIRMEFGAASITSHATGTGHTQQTRVVSDRYRRRLEALQQVGAAAARILNPLELSRIALDETLKILGAERAVLFQTDDSGNLQFACGRSRDGDLAELSGYSASLVERVATERHPVVITSGDEGAALGSQSTVIHGLRSIMIAPLELDGRLLGVMYLDSRIAKGIFTDEDVSILTAIANQVAVSIETARAAQLETAVVAAQQQRDTAETLRAAVNQLTAELVDPHAVLQQLCEVVKASIGADVTGLLMQCDGEITIAGELTEPSAGDAVELLALPQPLAGGRDDAPRAVVSLLGPLSAWLAIPLRTRNNSRGVLLAAVTERAFGPAAQDIAEALARQGTTAHENASLYLQAQESANTDALTGLLNRRQFANLAHAQLALAKRHERPLVGLMVDIDHFKRVNDTYGHSTGDEVIRAVATVLRTQIREPDVLCRYGGEEFALVMSEMRGDPVEVAERLRAAVAALSIPGPNGSVPVTVSIGIAHLTPDDDLMTLINRADEGLYQAKQTGRNRVCVS